MRNFIQHWFNPIHIFCRLKDMGLPKGKAMQFCSIYERFVYKPLFS